MKLELKSSPLVVRYKKYYLDEKIQKYNKVSTIFKKKHMYIYIYNNLIIVKYYNLLYC